MLLNEKVIIVSGVGPGLGRELALACAREGARIVLGARSGPYIDEVAKELEAAGARAVAVPTDISDPAQCRQLVEASVSEFGGVDGLVNNAFSVGELAVFQEGDLEAWRKAMDVNFFGSLALAREVIGPMKSRGGGSIVNVNTMSSRRVMLGQGAYGTSKAALAAATRQLAVELGPLGIRVNSAFLGPMVGPATDAAFANWAQRRGVSETQVRDEVAQNIALGFVTEDADCADAILFLLSDLSRVVTGSELEANGGAFLETRTGNAIPGEGE